MTQEQRLERIDERTRFQRVPNTSVSAEPVGEDKGELQWIRINFRDEHGMQHPLESMETPLQYADIVRWFAEQETPFSVQTFQARFPATPLDELKRVLKVVAC